MPIFQANGDISLCIDRKNDQRTVIGKHDPIENILNVWGSEDHKRIIDSIDVEHDCQKCTFNEYNVQIEKAVIEDKLDWMFT
jgi:hypothetical protein